jgi:Type III secretion protein (HpaP)
MASTPKVPYRSLKVHTGAAPSSTAPAEPARARFADLLRRRPASTSPPRLLRAPQPGRGAPAGAAMPAVPARDEAADAASGATSEATADGVVEATQEGAAAPSRVEEAIGTPAPQLGAPAPSPLSLSAAQVADAGHIADQAIAQYLARTVLDFCNDSAVRSGDGWQVSLPLRRDLLNATTLHLSLSPHWLLLRFATHDERTRRLLLMHQTSLQSMLDEALEPRREVSISFD